MKKQFLYLLIPLVLSSCKSKEEEAYLLVKNDNGPTLGYTSSSGVKILTIDNLKFKNLNKNNELDPYEDWRLPVEKRAEDLANKMSIEQIAGLMLYSVHQMIPAPESGFGASTYGGVPFAKVMQRHGI